MKYAAKEQRLWQEESDALPSCHSPFILEETA